MSEYKKPPLGVEPAWISSGRRIKDLAECIARYVDDSALNHYQRINGMALEILQHCDIIKMEDINQKWPS